MQGQDLTSLPGWPPGRGNALRRRHSSLRSAAVDKLLQRNFYKCSLLPIVISQSQREEKTAASFSRISLICS